MEISCAEEKIATIEAMVVNPATVVSPVAKRHSTAQPSSRPTRPERKPR
ncbi:hypothetical protein GCM10017673_06370 [Streptosporangium violaceochromogenes]|nr:hypothetical protein GCM10017673_06370 [Streptosporangium violaceochromogenes]